MNVNIKQNDISNIALKIVKDRNDNDYREISTFDKSAEKLILSC